MSIKWMLLNGEKVLEDDYTVYHGYVYIVDGVLTRCSIFGTVKDLKGKGVKEVRRCNIHGRVGARLGDTIRI